ncbi:DUF2975 domain-containing protein [Nocardiopsis sp. EMB25]|uniref:DUF2975 domain-containing protein n=1 Tax=Nocardiopsis sp. EMB25 TaxID=2835867 RepID=UPI002284846D|nr:DUF2975 domain-containing protein [Nocardiopsis sp. EMB25]MCY9784816.1 DUF2975 domain-containing protein [Nocardiopsis sp. EMB25]
MSTRTRLAWSKADDVVLRGLLLMGIAATSLTGLFLLVWTTPLLPADTAGELTTITVHAPAATPPPPVDVPVTGEDVEVRATESLAVTFHDPTLPERLLLVLPTLVGVAATLLVLVVLLRMARTLAQGDPFVPANVRRMYVVAATVTVGSLAVPLVRVFTDAELQSRALDPDGLVLVAFGVGVGEVPFPLVFVGLALAALAEVFRRGTGLREDVEGLV